MFTIPALGHGDMVVSEPEQAADPAEPGHGPRDGTEGPDQLHAPATARRRQRGPGWIRCKGPY